MCFTSQDPQKVIGPERATFSTKATASRLTEAQLIAVHVWYILKTILEFKNRLPLPKSHTHTCTYGHTYTEKHTLNHGSSGKVLWSTLAVWVCGQCITELCFRSSTLQIHIDPRENKGLVLWVSWLVWSIYLTVTWNMPFVHLIFLDVDFKLTFQIR